MEIPKTQQEALQLGLKIKKRNKFLKWEIKLFLVLQTKNQK
jgi:hypothetical protein